jgi:hypothetical protein
MIKQIEIGDTVRISDKSGHYGSGSSNPMGEGISIAHKDDDWPYRVLWPDGQTNSYKSYDLILIKKGKTMKFTKSDLKTGMFVKHRAGDYKIVTEQGVSNVSCHVHYDAFSENLLRLGGSPESDIMSVYKTSKSRCLAAHLDGVDLFLIWERTEQTPAQKEMEALQAQIDKGAAYMSELHEQAKRLQAKL